MPNIYQFSLNQIDGTTTSLEKYQGKVLLLVNVASQCGLTPQYEALEKIYAKYKEQGFEVLAFPANDFGAQEPGSNEEIRAFCQAKYGVNFPLFEKISVKEEDQHPFYQFLTGTLPEAQVGSGPSFEEKLKGYGISRAKNNDILWNFEKFLVNRSGKVVKRFSPDMVPDDPLIVSAIEGELQRE